MKSKVKTFFCALIGTSLFIVLLTGFVIAEKNTRYIAFGDNSPLITYEYKNFKLYFLKIHFMGKDYIIYKR